ncbi:MAG: hypothetical protein LRZ84_08605 [Desertifilum sp.]|nr:hypothetical protein [Desertifilum sp.]
MIPINVIENFKAGLAKFDSLPQDERVKLIGTQLWARRLVNQDEPSQHKIDELIRYFDRCGTPDETNSFEYADFLLHGGGSRAILGCRVSSPNDANPTPTKRIVNWGGVKLAVQHEQGDLRFEGATPLQCAYGCILGSYGKAEDGKGIDFYLANEPGDKIYVALQSEINGAQPESKWLIGFESLDAAKTTLTAHIGEARLQGIREAELWELEGILAKRVDYNEFVQSFTIYRAIQPQPEVPLITRSVFLCLSVPPSKLIDIPETTPFLEIISRETNPHITLVYCGEVELVPTR